MALRGMPEVLFSSIACFSFLAAGGKERELESLLKALGQARRQQLWQRERSGGRRRRGSRRRRRRRRVSRGGERWGVSETGRRGRGVCCCANVRVMGGWVGGGTKI